MSSREREILDFMLGGVAGIGIDALRKQASVALAKSWECGCASIDLLVDREAAPPSSITARPAIEAASNERQDPLRVFDLLLWVEDGWLSGIEIVEYGFERHEDSPDEFPPASDFAPPVFRSAAHEPAS